MKRYICIIAAAIFASALIAFPAAAASDNIFRFSMGHSAATVYPYGNNNELQNYVESPLYRYVPNKAGDNIVLVPDLAADEPTTEDGITWHIKIDPRAKWANGEPINADTFLYSWKRALDPNMTNPGASALARNTIDVENAFAYYTQAKSGKEVKWEDVGFKKVDEMTIAVKTSDKYSKTQVMQHFMMIYTSPAYEPLFEAGMDETKTQTNYGSSPETFMSSGPFILEGWTKGTEVILKKNPNYVHADEIHHDGMIGRVVQDENTQLQLYESGQLDVLLLGPNGIERYIDDPATYVYSSPTIRELEFNFEHPKKPYFNNVNFRKAIFFGIDRATLAKLTNSTAAPFFLPQTYSTMPDNTSYRSLPGAQAIVPSNNGYDPDRAKELFEIALRETGTEKVEINLLYNEAYVDQRLASEAIQNQLTSLFGEARFKMTLTAMNNAQLVRLMRTAQNGPTDGWDMGWGAWNLTAAQLSANRKFEVYTSTDARRFTQYNNPVINELYPKSTTAEYRLDPAKMTQIVLDMEKAYFDNADTIPLYQVVQYWRFSERAEPGSKECLPIIGFFYPLCRIVK